MEKSAYGKRQHTFCGSAAQAEQARGDGQGNRVRIPDGKRRCMCLSRTGVDENRSLGNWEGSPSRRWLNLFIVIYIIQMSTA